MPTSLHLGGTPEGKVSVGGLGSYLKRADPSFSPKNFGHSGLLDMLKTYELLKLNQEIGGHWTVELSSMNACESTRILGTPSMVRHLGETA